MWTSISDGKEHICDYICIVFVVLHLYVTDRIEHTYDIAENIHCR